MSEENNPFVQLSNLFVENQRVLSVKSDELAKRSKSLSGKLSLLSQQLEENVFKTNLVSILNIDEEARLILSVAKELEFQRDQILTSVKMLSESKQVKLNK